MSRCPMVKGRQLDGVQARWIGYASRSHVDLSAIQPFVASVFFKRPSVRGPLVSGIFGLGDDTVLPGGRHEEPQTGMYCVEGIDRVSEIARDHSHHSHHLLEFPSNGAPCNSQPPHATLGHSLRFSPYGREACALTAAGWQQSVMACRTSNATIFVSMKPSNFRALLEVSCVGNEATGGVGLRASGDHLVHPEVYARQTPRNNSLPQSEILSALGGSAPTKHGNIPEGICEQGASKEETEPRRGKKW